MLLCMIGTAHEWATLHMAETHGQGGVAKFDELLGCVVALDRQLTGCGLEVLAHGQHIDV